MLASNDSTIRHDLPNIFGKDDSSIGYIMKGVNSIDDSVMKHSMKPSQYFKGRNNSLNYDYTTHLSDFTMLSRHRRNQRTLDRITVPEIRMKAELSRIRRDISDNIL
jgi:hypothetical protein